ncbi:MAG: DegT/DnrJ/EryC1/StrS family aminotransferase [Qipengyuania sp.]
MNHPFPLATSSWDEDEYAAIQRVIDSDRFTMGPEVKAFETQFAEHFGSRYAVMVNSGSSANLAMIAALFFTGDETRRLKRGDEIIVPAVSWSTTYAPLAQYGLHLRFVDIDIDTLNYDLDALEAAVSDTTRAIMAVNLLGNPNDFARIEAIVAGRDITVLEDNCESMGASLGGKMAGTFGLMGTFSTFFSHHISTMEGGVVVTDDEELYQLLLSLRAHGWTRDLPEKSLIATPGTGDRMIESFRFILPGYNLRPLEMSGAIGQEQIRKLPGLIEGRRANAGMFQDRLRDHPVIRIQREIGKSSWFGFSLILREGVDMTRYELAHKLSALGFETRPIVSGNFVAKEVIRHFDHSVHEGVPNAEHLDANGLFIGNHHYPIQDALAALAAI